MSELSTFPGEEFVGAPLTLVVEGGAKVFPSHFSKVGGEQFEARKR